MTTLNDDINRLKSDVSKLQCQVANLEKLLPKTVPKEREIDLPEHLYKTFHALLALGGEATARQVASRSGLSRAIESAHLNILFHLDVVSKFRQRRKVVFQIIKMGGKQK